MPRFLLIIVAVVVLAAAAIVDGTLSNRWNSEDLAADAAKLNNVPAAFGRWTSTENPIDPLILRRAEAVSSVSRTYDNEITRSRLSVLMLCGPAGPIGAHTPDICYAGMGYKMIGHEIRKDVADSQFWSGRFEKPSGESAIVVSWAWSVDGTWVAAERPRWEFLGRKGLYKLYTARALTQDERDNRPAGEDPTVLFLTEFLPEVKKALAN